MYQLEGLNVELTTCCPLHCPQCYCTLTGKKNISPVRVFHIIDEAKTLGATHIEFSGGESLCYPYLDKVIAYASKRNINSSISTSGWNFTYDRFQRLVDAGIGDIYISLNGPTEESNSLTRDGYNLSISALSLLKSVNYNNTVVNWVMHRNSADMLPEMIHLCDEFDVSYILIIEPKPSSKYEMNTYPTKEQLIRTADIVKHQQFKTKIIVHHCFSSLLALSSENKLWGNLNRGLYKGCSAGLTSMSVSVDGKYMPCRHLEVFEDYDSLEDYWNKSNILNKIRQLNEDSYSSCKSCRLFKFCRHCLSENYKTSGIFSYNNDDCPLNDGDVV